MDNNKVNSWMISTAVLALVVGFLIGCDSPRQQVSAQTSSGVTASELDFITGKYNGIPDSFTVIIPASEFYTDFLTVPAGKVFVVTSFHMDDSIYSAVINNLLQTPIWLGRNFNPEAAGLIQDFDSQMIHGYLSEYVEAGLIPGSKSMGNYGGTTVLAATTGGRSYSPILYPRRDMHLVFEGGESVSLIRAVMTPQNPPVTLSPQVNSTVNGYWLNAE